MSNGQEPDGCLTSIIVVAILIVAYMLCVGDIKDVSIAKTPGGAEYWAVMQPSGEYNWYECPRKCDVPLQPVPNTSVETYQATGKFIIQNGKTAEIYELVKVEQ